MFIFFLICRMLMDPVGKKEFAIHFTKVGIKHANLCTVDYIIVCFSHWP